MTYIIRANNIDYTLRLHAIENMRKRFISEAQIVKTLEEGELTDQAHGNDFYELQDFDEALGKIVIIQVVVNSKERAVITVIDDTVSRGE